MKRIPLCRAAAVILSLSLFLLPSAASALDEPADTDELTRLTAQLDEALAAEHDGALIVYSTATAPDLRYKPDEEDASAPDADDFLTDLAASYSARLLVIDRYKDYETMSKPCYNYYRFACVEAERAFYEAYENAIWEDEEIAALCDRYLSGLRDQLDAEQLWLTGGSAEEIDALYLQGHTARIEVLAEAVLNHDLSLDESEAELLLELTGLAPAEEEDTEA